MVKGYVRKQLNELQRKQIIDSYFLLHNMLRIYWLVNAMDTGDQRYSDHLLASYKLSSPFEILLYENTIRLFRRDCSQLTSTKLMAASGLSTISGQR